MVPYKPDMDYPVTVAYFSMEYAIDQALKIYSGGLGFLAGSHLRSAYSLGQNLTAIGILWSYGYYDQLRDNDASMKPEFIRKHYSFLEDTGIQFAITVHDAPVQVKVMRLDPETFGTVPLYLMTTDIPENDYLSRTISHRLYDPNEPTRIAQSILLGSGGMMLLESLKIKPDVYHLNEGHGLPLAFQLYRKYQHLKEVRQRLVFTIHTPEKAGNEEHSFKLLEKMSFFSDLPVQIVREFLKNDGPMLNYTETALKMSGKANGVSKINGEVTRNIWKGTAGICDIISITNAQNREYWADQELETALIANDDYAIIDRKKTLKKQLFAVVADQCGKLFDVDILTIVWARRIAPYKRADLLLYNWDRFLSIINSRRYPVQVIWAGKPYPEDEAGITLFNRIRSLKEFQPNCAVLTGYELQLSAMLKKGSDIWLNTPRMFHEASGTSGMSAAMNCSMNVSIPDGWIPEFAVDNKNCFIIPPAKTNKYTAENDREEARNLIDLLEHKVIPMYYQSITEWLKIIKRASLDVNAGFDSDRMVNQYTYLLYDQADQDQFSD